MVAALGDQPQDVLRGAADEVLAWLKVTIHIYNRHMPQKLFHSSW